MDINGLSGSNNVGQRARAQAAGPAGGASPTMGGDQLQLSSNKPTIVDEAKAMTEDQAQKAVHRGGIAIGAGILGVGAAYWGSGALLAATGTMLAPVILGVGAAALGLWGAMQLGKGLASNLNRATEKAFKLPDGT
jgi:hypothetical protein